MLVVTTAISDLNGRQQASVISPNVFNEAELVIPAPNHIGIILTNKTLCNVTFKSNIIVCFKLNSATFTEVVTYLTVLAPTESEAHFKSHSLCYLCKLLNALNSLLFYFSANRFIFCDQELIFHAIVSHGIVE